MNTNKHGLESRNFMNGRKTERLKFAGSFFLSVFIRVHPWLF
jgi:hypothetical protein